MKCIIEKLLNSFGYSIVKKQESTHPDLDPAFLQIFAAAQPYTMTSIERMYALYLACKYISQNQIQGDMVECGVWKGGSAMMASLTFLQSGDDARNIFLYDTFEGMSDPTEKDVSFKDEKVIDNWKYVRKNEKIFCYSSLDEVRRNMVSTGYPSSNIQLIKGKVEDTIPQTLPEKIALLRLDTDWYESTYHELKYLYPLLVTGGVLIIDDYGHWKGARDAVDQYFKEQNIRPLLHRIDYTGRITVKI